MGFTDLNLISLVDFKQSGGPEIEDSGNFIVKYALKAYDKTQADTFLAAQSGYFGSDSASLIAQIQEVKVDHYDGTLTYNLIEDGKSIV
jgi:hypothetical protein